MELNPEQITPLFDKIVVQVEPSETMTASGLHLPKAQDSKFRKGTVKSVGPGKRLDNGKFAALVVKVEDEVIFGAYAGVGIDDKNGLVLISEDEIYAITKAEVVEKKTTVKKASV